MPKIRECAKPGCGFVALKNEIYCYHHSNSERGKYLREKHLHAVEKKPEIEKRMSDFEKEIFNLLSFKPKSEKESQQQLATVKKVVSWIREIRRS